MTDLIKRWWLEFLELIFPDKSSEWSAKQQKGYNDWKRKVNKL